MAVNHSIKTTYNRGQGPAIVVTRELSSEGDRYISLNVPVQSDFQIDFAFVRARLKALLIKAGDALTIKTNSTSVPGNTFTVDTDKPLEWNVNSQVAVNTMFAADVTTIYVTNANADPVAIEIIALLDSTP